MSEKIFNSAKLYVKKVLDILSVVDTCEGLPNSGCRIYERCLYKRNDILIRHGKQQSYYKVIHRSSDDSEWKKTEYNYRINSTGDNSMPGVNRAFMKIDAYSEDVDFQLSTLFNDVELFDYYVGSLLYTSGFRGYVRKFVHHNTWNSLLRNANIMYGSKEKLWKVPKNTEEPLFNF